MNYDSSCPFNPDNTYSKEFVAGCSGSANCTVDRTRVNEFFDDDCFNMDIA